MTIEVLGPVRNVRTDCQARLSMPAVRSDNQAAAFGYLCATWLVSGLQLCSTKLLKSMVGVQGFEPWTR